MHQFKFHRSSEIQVQISKYFPPIKCFVLGPKYQLTFSNTRWNSHIGFRIAIMASVILACVTSALVMQERRYSRYLQA